MGHPRPPPQGRPSGHKGKPPGSAVAQNSTAAAQSPICPARTAVKTGRNNGRTRGPRRLSAVQSGRGVGNFPIHSPHGCGYWKGIQREPFPMATKNYPIPPGWSQAAPGSARSAEAGRVGLVAVATGSVLFERGLIHLIGELPQLRFAGSVRTAEAIPSLLATRDPDIVTLDVRLMDSLDDRATSTRQRPRLVLLSPRRYACINAQRLKTHVCSVFHLESSDAEMVSTLLTVHRCRQVQPGSPACETCPAWRMI